jgi:hypothetical protein
MNDFKEDLSPMVDVLRKLHEEGYTVQFRADESGITSNESQKHYRSEKVCIRHFYRFEGESSSDDSSIVYAIETKSGEKGTLIDSYGAYSDPHIAKFIREVESISK